MKITLKKIILLITITIAFSACKKEDNEPSTPSEFITFNVEGNEISSDDPAWASGGIGFSLSFYTTIFDGEPVMSLSAPEEEETGTFALNSKGFTTYSMRWYDSSGNEYNTFDNSGSITITKNENDSDGFLEDFEATFNGKFVFESDTVTITDGVIKY